jgi:hypothetical protein
VRTALWQGSATEVDPASADVPSNLRKVTGSYCLPDDPVCQSYGPLGGLNVVALSACLAENFAHGLCPHTSYGALEKGETPKAVNFILSKLPAVLTKTIHNTVGGESAFCNADNVWSFQLQGVGGSTGIEPPESITAVTANGSSEKIALARVTGDSDTFPTDTAFYETSANRKLTGDAAATINQHWNPQYPGSHWSPDHVHSRSSPSPPAPPHFNSVAQ